MNRKFEILVLCVGLLAVSILHILNVLAKAQLRVMLDKSAKKSAVVEVLTSTNNASTSLSNGNGFEIEFTNLLSVFQVTKESRETMAVRGPSAHFGEETNYLVITNRESLVFPSGAVIVRVTDDEWREITNSMPRSYLTTTPIYFYR